MVTTTHSIAAVISSLPSPISSPRCAEMRRVQRTFAPIPGALPSRNTRGFRSTPRDSSHTSTAEGRLSPRPARRRPAKQEDSCGSGSDCDRGCRSRQQPSLFERRRTRGRPPARNNASECGATRKRRLERAPGRGALSNLPPARWPLPPTGTNRHKPPQMRQSSRRARQLSGRTQVHHCVNQQRESGNRALTVRIRTCL